MKASSIIILGLTGILAVSSCSPAAEEQARPPAGTVADSNTSGNSNSSTVNDGTVVAAPQSANVNAPGSGDPVSPNSISRMEDIKKSGAAGPPVDPSGLAKKNARPAPDNSTFSAYLTDAGYEVRTFKDHPQLLKVEKKITGDGKQSLKIFLRGGKVVELPGDRINPLSTAPAALILETAGVQPKPQTPRAPAGPAPTKKSGE